MNNIPIRRISFLLWVTTRHFVKFGRREWLSVGIKWLWKRNVENLSSSVPPTNIQMFIWPIWGPAKSKCSDVQGWVATSRMWRGLEGVESTSGHPKRFHILIVFASVGHFESSSRTISVGSLDESGNSDRLRASAFPWVQVDYWIFPRR